MSAVKGISVTRPLGTSTRRILPLQAAISARESGVNDMLGSRSRVNRDSMSSRCTSRASHCSSPESMSRIRSDVTESARVAYTIHLPSGLSTGLKAPPPCAARVDVSPVSRSYEMICQSKPV
jgi:hypothetical protein